MATEATGARVTDPAVATPTAVRWGSWHVEGTNTLPQAKPTIIDVNYSNLECILSQVRSPWPFV